MEGDRIDLREAKIVWKNLKLEKKKANKGMGIDARLGGNIGKNMLPPQP